MQKKLFFLYLFLILTIQSAFAGNWNRYPYHSMSDRSYRMNYNSQINYKNVPYVHTHSNFSRSVKPYNNYSSYDNYVYKATQSKNYNSYMMK